MPTKKSKTIENKPVLVRPDFQKCACESCTIAGQFASPGWLCEFHRDAPPQYWPIITQKYKPFKKLYAIRNRLISDKGYGLDFDLFREIEGPKLAKELRELGYPELAPKDGEYSYRLSQRIFGYIYERVVLNTLKYNYLPEPERFPPVATVINQPEEPYVYDDAPF